MSLIIKAIKREPKLSKAGKNYTRLSFLADHQGQPIWFSGFGGKENEHWQKGTVLESTDIKIEQSGKWWNFETLKIGNVAPVRQSNQPNVESRLEALEMAVKALQNASTPLPQNAQFENQAMDDDFQHPADSEEVPF